MLFIEIYAKEDKKISRVIYEEKKNFFLQQLFYLSPTILKGAANEI